jgi:hypothetical protein
MPDFSSAPWNTTTLITPRHAVRERWNSRALRQWCQDHRRQIYRFHAEDTIKGKSLTREQSLLLELKMADRTHHGTWKSLPSTMEVAIGMRVLVTENIEKELDLTNGTRGEVVDIILDAREPPIDSECAVVTLKYLPRYFLIRIQREPGHGRKLENLEEDVTPVLPVTHFLQIEESVNGESLTRRIKRTQYTFTGAYALTDCRAQGLTMDSVIVDIARPPDRKGLSMFNIYVALSRSRGRDTIRLLRDFDQELLLKREDLDLRDDDLLTSRADIQTERNWRLSLTDEERHGYDMRCDIEKDGKGAV